MRMARNDSRRQRVTMKLGSRHVDPPVFAGASLLATLDFDTWVNGKELPARASL
jgi:hypothetical protein